MKKRELLTIGEAIVIYDIHQQRQVYLRCEKYTLRRLLAHCGERLPLAQLRPFTILAYLGTRSIADSSRAREINTIASWWTWIARMYPEEGLTDNPCKALSRAYTPTHRYARIYDNHPLWQALPSQKWDVRWIITSLHDTGIRPGELAGVRFVDIDISRRQMHIPHSKTRQRDVPLSSAMVRLLNERSEPVQYPRLRILQTWPRYRLSRLCKDVHILPYDLRKNWIAYAMEQNISMRVISDITGTAPATLTRFYCGPSPQQAAAAVELISGRDPKCV
jgi:integrase